MDLPTPVLTPVPTSCTHATSSATTQTPDHWQVTNEQAVLPLTPMST